MSPQFRRRLSAVCAGVALAAAGCDDRGVIDTTGPVGPPPASPSADGMVALTCTGSTVTRDFACRTDPAVVQGSDQVVRYSLVASADPAEGAVIMGGQNLYVTLANSTPTVDGSTFGIDVTLQNLIDQPIGTADGTTLVDEGVRVFFTRLPVVTAGTGTVTVKAGTPVATITAADQPYHQYDEVLAPDQVSAAKRWEFDYTGDVVFEFKVMVYAPVQFPNGWIDIATPTTFLNDDAAQQLVATVREFDGLLAAEQEVAWSTDAPGIATVDVNGLVSGVAPGVAVITASNTELSSARTMDVCPSLNVGEVYATTFPAAARLCLPGGESGAEYTYMPINMSVASSLSLSVTGSGITAVTGPPTPGPSVGLGVRTAAPEEMGGTLHMMQLEADRRLPRTAQPPRSAVNRDEAAGSRDVPAVGDLMNINVATSCSGGTDFRTGQVRSVSNRAIILSDTTNPAGGFTTAQYDSIALEFDTIAWHAITTEFGTPSDVDVNDRTILFFTRAMNELSPPASSVVSMARFTARDLFGTGDCSASNVGEIIYMLVPDPTGAVNSNVRTVSFVRGNTTRSSGHELSHLINASTRIYIPGGSLEEPWLDEHLSAIAEELMFYRTAPELTPGMDIALSTITGLPHGTRRVAAFNTYANGNFGRQRSWMQRPDTTGPFKNNVTLAGNGSGWSFLRYVADRIGGSESAFWQGMINTTLTGTANIEAAAGVSMSELVRDFIVATYADNAVAGAAAIHSHPSWHFRSVYGGLGGFPVVARPLTNNTPLTLSYSRGGGTMYGRFGVTTGTHATVTALSGGIVPTSPFELAVIRTK